MLYGGPGPPATLVREFGQVRKEAATADDVVITSYSIHYTKLYDLDAAHLRLRQLAAHEGVEMAERQRTYNSRRAQELGKS